MRHGSDTHAEGHSPFRPHAGVGCLRSPPLPQRSGPMHKVWKSVTSGLELPPCWRRTPVPVWLEFCAVESTPCRPKAQDGEEALVAAADVGTGERDEVSSVEHGAAERTARRGYGRVIRL